MENLIVSATGDRDIEITRVFDAPRHLVYEAHTRPELLKRWLGVFNGWSLDVCEVDLRVGGRYRYVWRGPDREEMGMGGVFLEIVPGEKIVTTEKFDQAWYEGEAVDTVVFEERGGKTTLRMTVRYASKEVRDAVLQSPMKDGMAAGYNTLEELLAKPA